jgi:ATP-dependent protease ClpP protease subunit
MTNSLIIPVVGIIDDLVAKNLIENLYSCLLKKRNAHIPICSAGGDGDQVLGAIEIIREMEKRYLTVTTINIGYAFSAAAMLLIGGTKDHRYGTPNSDIMIHRGTWKTEINGDTANTVLKYSKQTIRKFEDFYTSINGNRKKTLRWLRKDTYFTTQEALTERLIDRVGFPIN